MRLPRHCRSVLCESIARTRWLPVRDRLAPPNFDVAEPGDRLERRADDRHDSFKAHIGVNASLTRIPDDHGIGRVE